MRLLCSAARTGILDLRAWPGTPTGPAEEGTTLWEGPCEKLPKRVQGASVVRRATARWKERYFVFKVGVCDGVRFVRMEYFASKPTARTKPRGAADVRSVQVRALPARHAAAAAVATAPPGPKPKRLPRLRL